MFLLYTFWDEGPWRFLLLMFLGGLLVGLGLLNIKENEQENKEEYKYNIRSYFNLVIGFFVALYALLMFITEIL